MKWLGWRLYTASQNRLCTDVITKKEFAAAVFDLEHKVFVIYVAALNIDLGDKINSSKNAQIAHSKVDNAITKVPSRDTDFADVFLSKLAVELLKYTRINDYPIEVVDN